MQLHTLQQLVAEPAATRPAAALLAVAMEKEKARRDSKGIAQRRAADAMLPSRDAKKRRDRRKQRRRERRERDGLLFRCIQCAYVYP
jgi:hypothetical protein